MSWQGGSSRSYRTLNVCFRAERRSANLLIATGFAAALLPNLFVHRRAAIAGPTIKPVGNFAFRDSAIDLFKRFSKTAYCWATRPMPRNSSSVNGSLWLLDVAAGIGWGLFWRSVPGEIKMGYVFTQPIIVLVGRRGVEPRTYGLRVLAVKRGCS